MSNTDVSTSTFQALDEVQRTCISSSSSSSSLYQTFNQTSIEQYFGTPNAIDNCSDKEPLDNRMIIEKTNNNPNTNLFHLYDPEELRYVFYYCKN